MIKRLISAIAAGNRVSPDGRWTAKPAPGEMQADVRQNAGLSWLRRRARAFGTENYQRPIPLRTLLAVAGLATALGIFGYLALSPPPPGSSRLERAPSMKSTPGGDRQRESQRYRDTLRSSNIIKADEADRSGRSFMPVPEGLPEQTPRPAAARSFRAAADDPLDVSLTARQAAERVAAATETPAQLSETDRAAAADSGMHSDPVSAAVPGPAQADNPYEAAILRQMSAITRAMETAGPASTELIAGANGRDMAWPADAADAPGATAPAAAAIVSGEILEGELITLIDSDVPAPVAVRMTSGPAVGGVLIGGFAANSRAGGLIMEFSRLAMPEGAEIAVQAMALDQSTRGAAVRGEVNSRPVQRYGPMLVSSFVSGFAANAARPATTIVNTANGIIAANEKPSIEDSLIAGAGQAATAAASDLAQAAPNAPRIRIYPGATVNILFLSPVPIPASQ